MFLRNILRNVCKSLGSKILFLKKSYFIYLALLVISSFTFLPRNLVTLLTVDSVTLLLILTMLFGNIFTGLPIVVGWFTLLFIACLANLAKCQCKT